MKKIIFLFLGLAAGLLGGRESTPAPVLHYDFTSPVICRGGQYKQPVIPPEAGIASPDPALSLAGENSRIQLLVPGGSKITLANGGTLYALVRFDQGGKKGYENLDMIFFKNKDFLLGRTKDRVYFNMGAKWDWSLYAPGVPVKKWTLIAATVRKDAPGFYTVKLFIDGRLAAEKAFERNSVKPTAEPLTLGKGWGGPWYFYGLLGKVLIYDKALSEEEILAMSRKEPYLKK